MSSGLAIAAVTAVLKDLLNNGLIDHDLTPSVGDVTVTALPPDRVSTAADEKRHACIVPHLYVVSGFSRTGKVRLKADTTVFFLRHPGDLMS